MNQQSSLLIKTREAVASSEIPFDFSSEVIKETTEIESEFKWPFIGKRLDLRGKTTFTLGSPEVAFSVERKNDDFLLGIHSADVANLFAFGSAIDKSAFEKGRSAVLPQKTHSMIPEAISGFCSLTEGKECFTVSVFIKLSSKGKVSAVKFAESVIKVTANCEPEEVEALLFDIDVSSVGFLRYKYHAVLTQLEDMFGAGAILKMARENRGAEEIDTAVRVFSRKGIRGDVVNVGFKKLSDPERLVREIISAAGVEISRFLSKNSIPCPHRSRPAMSKDGNKKLREFLNTVCIDTRETDDKRLVAFASDKAHGDKNEELILAKIKELLPSSECSLKPEYHHGIASGYYTRFAYPASRYGDLCVQRIIKAIAQCNGDFSSLDMELLSNIASKAIEAVMSNETKVKALETKVSDLYSLEFLNNNKNKIFSGTIWNTEENCIKILLDNGCKGYIAEGYKSNQDFVPCQRMNFRVVDVLWDKEIAIFDPMLASQSF